MGASNDSVVPAAQQERFAEAMRRAGHDAALLLFHGTGNHGGDHGQVCVRGIMRCWIPLDDGSLQLRHVRVLACTELIRTEPDRTVPYACKAY